MPDSRRGTPWLPLIVGTALLGAAVLIALFAAPGGVPRFGATGPPFAAAPPTTMPGAPPTVKGPLSGPVPATETPTGPSPTPQPTPDCAHPHPFFIVNSYGGPTPTPLTGQSPLTREGVVRYLQTYPLGGGDSIGIESDPHPTITSVELTTWGEARGRYPMTRVSWPADGAPAYIAELAGRFVVRESLPGVRNGTICGWPPGVIGVFSTGVAIFDAQTGALLVSGGR